MNMEQTIQIKEELEWCHESFGKGSKKLVDTTSEIHALTHVKSCLPFLLHISSLTPLLTGNNTSQLIITKYFSTWQKQIFISDSHGHVKIEARFWNMKRESKSWSFFLNACNA